MKNRPNKKPLPGAEYVVDKDFQNASTVVVHSITKDGMFAVVYPPGEPEQKWELMTNRLTIKNS